jgi:hypothetical protein
MNNSIFKFARRCDITGEGMNEGWVINDHEKFGLRYYKHEADVLAYAKERGYDSLEALYEACEESGELDEFYYTEWDELDDDEWYVSYYEDGREAVLVSDK